MSFSVPYLILVVSDRARTYKLLITVDTNEEKHFYECFSPEITVSSAGGAPRRRFGRDSP